MRNAIVRELLSHLDEVLTRLEEHRSVSFEEYVANWDMQQVIERGMQRTVQACIDIGARIIAQHGFRHAEGYHEIFDILASEGILPSYRLQSILDFMEYLRDKEAWEETQQILADKELISQLDEADNIAVPTSKG